jgi:hypothetical protein
MSLVPSVPEFFAQQGDQGILPRLRYAGSVVLDGE